MAVALDKLARPVRDLRISVTDRCNFRCVYCMPKEVFGKQFEFLRREQLLTFEEIERLTHTFAGMGVEKLRITGGEPLVRRGVDELIARLAAVPGIRDVTLTTNGSLLARMAQRLADAGLNRVTVSLDSLDDDDVPRDERRRLPRRRRARRHRRSARRRPRAGQGQHGRQARDERRRHPRDGRALPRHGRDPALHRVHGRRRNERLAARRGRAVGRDRERDRRALAARARRARRTAARSRRATATATAPARSASSRPSRSRSATTARARASRPRASSTPACSRVRGHDLRAMRAQRAVRRRARREAARPLARARRPLLGAAHAGHARSTCPRSRCRTSAASAGLSARLAGACDEQLHADVLAARPLADARREWFRTLLERHDPGGVDALGPPGGSRRASADEGVTRAMS